MAENKTEAKSPKAKPKAAAKTAGEKSAAKAKKAGADAAAVSNRGTCTAPKCAQPLRAKGYCRKHFMAWRREKLGAHHHYKICSKEACRKKRELGGLCAEHAKPAAAAP